MAAFRAELQKAHRRHDLALCLLIPGMHRSAYRHGKGNFLHIAG